MAEHFRPEDWIDYARALGTEDKRETMRQHLESGCNACEASLLFWTGIRQAASREASYQPPEGTVRIVKAIVPILQVHAAKSLLTVIADLIEDSSLQPAAAGFRSSAVAPWLLLYKAGNVSIDLRFEEVPTSSRISVVGQVMDLSSANQPISGASVALSSREGEMDRTATNQFGEFQMEFEPQSGMQFAVRITENKEILVPLKRSIPKVSGGTLY